MKTSFIKTFFSVVLVIAFSSSAFAQSQSTSPYANDPIFKKTINECSALGPFYLQWERLKSAWNTFDIGAFWNLSSAVHFYQNGGVSPQLRAQLDSDAFYEALSVCYPKDEFGNEFAQNSFIFGLIVNDLRGSAVGGIAAFALAPAKILKAIRFAHPKTARVITVSLLSLATVRVSQVWKEFFSESKRRGNEEVDQLTNPPKDEIHGLAPSVGTIIDDRIRYLKAQLLDPSLSNERVEQIKQEIKDLEKQRSNVSDVSLELE